MKFTPIYMSNQVKEFLANLRLSCRKSIEKRFSRLEDAQRVSRVVRDRSIAVFVHYQALDKMADELTYDPSYEAFLAAVDSSLDDSKADLNAVEQSLLNFMSQLNRMNENEVNIGVLTNNPLNKRMIDALFLLKDKIRIARQRLNDAGEEYDAVAYVNARNRCSLAQSIYIGQLHRDIVSCTNEEVATIEQLHLPAIENASGATFVESIDQTATFLEARIIAPLA